MVGTEKELFKVCEVSVTYSPKIKASQRISILSVTDLHKLLRNLYDSETIEYKEYFKVVLLNKANKVLGIHNLSEGGIDGNFVDIRIILQIALLANATNIILSHNHPSGNIEPSIQDKRLTEAVKQACNIMNISLLDHIIITTESYFSFAEENLI